MENSIEQAANLELLYEIAESWISWTDFHIQKDFFLDEINREFIITKKQPEVNQNDKING